MLAGDWLTIVDHEQLIGARHPQQDANFIGAHIVRVAGAHTDGKRAVRRRLLIRHGRSILRQGLSMAVVSGLG